MRKVIVVVSVLALAVPVMLAIAPLWLMFGSWLLNEPATPAGIGVSRMMSFVTVFAGCALGIAALTDTKWWKVKP